MRRPVGGANDAEVDERGLRRNAVASQATSSREILEEMAPPRFRLGRRLGAGGMADVYEATLEGEAGFTRRVAIKRMRELDGGDPSFARMFLDEARIASALHHANVVGVLDYGTDEGVPYQVLELIDGLDASTLARKGRALGTPMPPEVALYVVSKVGQALHYAHNAKDQGGQPLGVVHRDVKPSNVFLSWEGDVKLGDFGIAFAFARSERTQAGTAKGTPAYMAPEQLLGRQVDGRADVFSLGCTLCALLCGKSPLDSFGPARLLVGETIELPSTIEPDVRALLERALAVRAEDRFETAGAFARATAEAATRRSSLDLQDRLVAWLAVIRPAVPPPVPPPAALDDLFALGEPTNDPGDEVATPLAPRDSLPPTFAASPARGSTPDAKKLNDASLPALQTVTDSESRQPTGSRGRRRNVLAAALALLAAVASAAVARGVLLRASNERLASSGSPSATARVEPDASIVGTVEIAHPASSASDAPSAGVATGGVAPIVSGARRKGSLDRPPSDTATTVASARKPPDPAPETSPALRGWLVVAGGNAHGAEVLVDGRSVGHAPTTVELPLGDHAVSLVAPDGHRVATTSVRLRSDNTRSAPFRWTP